MRVFVWRAKFLWRAQHAAPLRLLHNFRQRTKRESVESKPAPFLHTAQKKRGTHAS